MSNFPNDKRLSKYLPDQKYKMWAFFVFEIKGAKEDKIFKFLKGRFSMTGGAMDLIFAMFAEIYMSLLKSTITISQFF